MSTASNANMISVPAVTYAGVDTAGLAEKVAIRNLEFFYGDARALKSISLPLYANKTTAFIGPSGCGKSTLLRVLNRMYDLYPGQRAEGEIIMDGENAWEHYPENAWYFLSALYRRLAEHPKLELTTFSECLKTVAPQALRVLVIDDDPEGARSLSELFRCYGCATAVAYSGRVGLRLAKLFKPELVFVDFDMPDMNGLEVVSEAKVIDAEAGRHCMYVCLTAGGPEITQEKADAAGFSRLLYKPLKVTDLLAVLHRPFDEHPKHESWAQIAPEWASRIEVSCSS